MSVTSDTTKSPEWLVPSEIYILEPRNSQEKTMLKCVAIATIHNYSSIQLQSSGVWISPLLWHTACLSYKILLYTFIVPLAQIFHLCWWNSMVCVTLLPWNDCNTGIKVRIISEISFVVKMNEGGFSKKYFSVRKQWHVRNKIVGKNKLAWRNFYEQYLSGLQ